MTGQTNPTAARIRQARLAARLSMPDVALMYGCTRQYINTIETSTRPIGLEVVLRFASILGVDPHTLDERLAPLAKGD